MSEKSCDLVIEYDRQPKNSATSGRMLVIFLFLTVVLAITITVVVIAYQYAPGNQVLNAPKFGDKNFRSLKPPTRFAKFSQHRQVMENKTAHVRAPKFNKVKLPVRQLPTYPAGTFVLSPNTKYYIQNMNNAGVLTPSIGVYPGGLSGTSLVYGGYVVNTDASATNENLYFQFIVPSTTIIPLPDDTYLMQNSYKPGLQWSEQFGVMTTAVSKEYPGSTQNRNDNDINQLFTIEIYVNVNLGVAICLIKSVANGKYLRICNSEGCLSNGNVLLCGGNSANLTYVSADYTLSEATSDDRGQWLFTLL